MDNDSRDRFDPENRRRPRRLEDAESAEIGFPLVWIVIGGLAGLIVIGLVGLGVVNLVRQSAITPTPPVLSPMVEQMATATIIPTMTIAAPAVETAASSAPDGATTPAPENTPAVAEVAPDELAVGGYAVVEGTDGAGLSMRAGPGRNNARLGLAEEDAAVKMELLEGPTEDANGEDYIWWFVRHPDGTEGWVVQDFLVPTTAP